MENLCSAPVHQNLQITGIDGDEAVIKHLRDLGFIPGARIVLLKNNGNSGIVLVHQTRLALDRSVLQRIQVTAASDQQEILSLDQLQVGESGKVIKIFGEGPVRRRLMDMGLTKGVVTTVNKVAPLGDPIDLSLRGYNLSIRKNEAEYILVEKEVSQ